MTSSVYYDLSNIINSKSHTEKAVHSGFKKSLQVQPTASSASQGCIIVHYNGYSHKHNTFRVGCRGPWPRSPLVRSRGQRAHSWYCTDSRLDTDLNVRGTVTVDREKEGKKKENKIIYDFFIRSLIENCFFP